MLEIEKTFLVKKFPGNLKKYKAVSIQQGYLSKPPSPLRIRKKGDKYEITKKLPVHGEKFWVVDEINIPLRVEEFNLLWLNVLRSLEKTRYLVPLPGKLVAELDVFEGKLSGLSLVEVEFGSEEELKVFVPPDWFGRDVTDEEFSANSFLAGKSFAGIKKYLKPPEG